MDMDPNQYPGKDPVGIGSDYTHSLLSVSDLDNDDQCESELELDDLDKVQGIYEDDDIISRKPQLLLVRKSSLLDKTGTTRRSFHKSVSFGSVHIREHNVILGDNPSCSSGPPLSLGWDYADNQAVGVEDQEFEKLARTPYQQLFPKINVYQRKHILIHSCGYSDHELIDARKQVEKVQFQRWITKALLPAQKIEEGIESAKRKLRRAASFINVSSRNVPGKSCINI